MDLTHKQHFWEWGPDTRGYVGPKGWKISRNHTDKTWMITHYYYTNMYLIMQDIDALPMGRHRWRVENNVCNGGITNYQDLLISGCEEGDFTCDDGKCLDISQRCNNIEVKYDTLSLLVHFKFFQECDDVSDEKSCKTVYVDPEKYLKTKPPPSIEKSTKLPIKLRYLVSF